jgi:acyl-CoA thioesterase FadM
MAPEIISRWPTRLDVALIDGDCDADGRLNETGAARLFALAREAYFDESTAVDQGLLALRTCTIRIGDAPVAGHKVSVSVNVSELYDDEFTMTSRMRPTTGAGIAANGTCSLGLAGGVTRAVRDEFIAREHGARYTH